MDWELTQNQRMIRDLARRFAESEIGPRAGELDATGEHPREVLKGLGELKMLGLAVPEEYGGGGMDQVSYVLALMEISGTCASTGTIMMVNNSLYCAYLTAFGSEEQKVRYLYPCAAGDRLGCHGLAEAEAGSDLSALQTKAQKDGSDWVINGEKRFVTNGGVASYAVLTAATEKKGGEDRLTSFVLDLEKIPGFKVGRVEQTMGVRAASTAEMIFEEARAPADAVLGSPGEGWTQVSAILPGAWIGVAALAVGIGRAILAESLSYARSTAQSREPLGSFQAVQWKLADMACELDASELLALRAAWLQDHGSSYEKEAAMAKIYASDATMKASVEGVQILGGIGYCKRNPMERHMRDAKVCQISEGSNEIMRLVIAKNLAHGR